MTTTKETIAATLAINSDVTTLPNSLLMESIIPTRNVAMKTTSIVDTLANDMSLMPLPYNALHKANVHRGGWLCVN